jgi:hypothetical protein
MKRFYGTIRDASFEETPKGFYNAPQVLEYSFKRKKHVVVLDSGSSDDVDVYRDGESLFVLSKNTRLGYCGLQVFALHGEYTGEEIGNVFEQNPESIEDLAGWEDMAPYNLIRRLNEYIQVN